LSSLEVSLKDTLRTLLEDTQISVGQWRTTGGTSLDDTLEDTLEDIPEDTPEEVSSGFHGGRWKTRRTPWMKPLEVTMENNPE
jgi:hypothetical protein